MKSLSFKGDDLVVRVIRLFIGCDEKSQELANLFKSLVDASESEFRLDICYVNTEEREIEDFIELSYDIFGGAFIFPLLEYSVNLLPTILVGRDKVIEGRFPDLNEIERILERCGVYVDDETLEELASRYLATLKASEFKYEEEFVRADKCAKCFFYSHKMKFCLRYMSDVSTATINCDLRPRR